MISGKYRKALPISILFSLKIQGKQNLLSTGLKPGEDVPELSFQIRRSLQVAADSLKLNYILINEKGKQQKP